MLTDALSKLFSFLLHMFIFMCNPLLWRNRCTEAGGRGPILRGGLPLASSPRSGFRDMQVISEEPELGLV